MIDTKLLRENPERVREAIRAKGSDCDLDAVLETDFIWRSRLQEVEQLRSAQKAANEEMAAVPKGSPEFLAKVGELKALAGELKEKEAQLREVEERWEQAMLTVPNIPHESVPVSPDPSGNVVHTTWGD